MNDINFSSYGDGRKKTVILVHGWKHSSKIWHKIVNDLAKNYNVITLDLPGHGDSKVALPEDNDNLLEYLCDSLYDFIQDKKLSPYALVSHSMGGVITLMMIKKYDLKLDRLMILGSPYCGLPSSFFSFLGKKVKLNSFLFKTHKKMPKFLNRSLTKVFSKISSIRRFKDVDESVYDAVYKSSPLFTAKLFKELVNSCFKLDKKLNVKKAFVARGEKDPLSSTKDLKVLSDFLDGEYYEFKDISHAMMLESSDELLKIMNNFLA